MTKKLITDEEMESLQAKGCIGLCPICGMPLYKGRKHEDCVFELTELNEAQQESHDIYEEVING